MNTSISSQDFSFQPKDQGQPSVGYPLAHPCPFLREPGGEFERMAWDSSFLVGSPLNVNLTSTHHSHYRRQRADGPLVHALL